MNIVENAERLDRQRNLSLFLQLMGFTIWRIADIVLHDLNWQPGLFWGKALTGAMLLGWLVWLGALSWLIWWLMALRNQQRLRQLLNDEGIVRSRTRALQFGFWVMLACLVVGRMVTAFVMLPSALILDVLIWVIVVSQIGGYLWFSRV